MVNWAFGGPMCSTLLLQLKVSILDCPRVNPSWSQRHLKLLQQKLVLSKYFKTSQETKETPCMAFKNNINVSKEFVSEARKIMWKNL